MAQAKNNTRSHMTSGIVCYVNMLLFFVEDFKHLYS